MTVVFMLPAIAFTITTLAGFVIAGIEDYQHGETAQAGVLIVCSAMVGLGAIACWTVALS
jgi:hypothetical protein